MTTYPADIIQQRIDTFWKENQEDGRRNHLGGSLIGRECNRELWYSFRWATETKHDGRILRLFKRGHKEEFEFVEYLQQLGIEVREYAQRLGWHQPTDKYVTIDWEVDLPEYKKGHCVDVTSDAYHVARAKEAGVRLEQWRIEDVFGHFGGSLDGIAYNLPEVEIAEGVYICAKDPVLLEFKTHGQKSFDTLCKLGLKDAKPEHYAQMQVYMAKRGIKFGLYMAVNKNTDELKCYFVVAVPMEGFWMISRAQEIITAKAPPARISSNPSWFKCRFCDHRKPCHMGQPLAKNCRTCIHSNPIDGGQWHCQLWDSVIPIHGQKEGCDNYTQIEE